MFIIFFHDNFKYKEKCEKMTLDMNYQLLFII